MDHWPGPHKIIDFHEKWPQKWLFQKGSKHRFLEGFLYSNNYPKFTLQNPNFNRVLKLTLPPMYKA